MAVVAEPSGPLKRCDGDHLASRLTATMKPRPSDVGTGSSGPYESLVRPRN